MFSYKWATAIDQPDYSLWMLLYMERVAFFTIITPKEHTPPTDKCVASVTDAGDTWENLLTLCSH